MQFQLIKERNEIALKSEADYVAPYLVYYAETSPDIPQSVAVYHACLDNLKKDFLEYLNELQRRYDEVNICVRAPAIRPVNLLYCSFFPRSHTQHVSEALHFKRFLKKFQDKFDDTDYQRLIKEGETIEMNKRMLQQRLMTTRAVSQAKYDTIKRRLLADSRLNFDEHFLINEHMSLKKQCI